MNMNELILKSDYKNILKYFKEISEIPRGSGNNRGISNYLIEFARAYGFKAVQDEALNVIIYKDASIGYEDAPTVIIQGHMDMVCVKKEGLSHDFINEGLKLLVDGDYIKADGTTLGADNGIALSYGLALISDDSISHPAIELLYTTDEETGMDGAKAVDETKLKGSMVINIDSEDDDTVLTGCAGGLTIEGRMPIDAMPLKSMPLNRTGYILKIAGLKGGHSGIDIAKGRTNAITLMARLLTELSKNINFYLSDFKGGEKDNAIPSLCEAMIIIEEAKQNNLDIKDKVKRLADIYKHEFITIEPSFNVSIEKTEVKAECTVLTKHSSENFLTLINLSPNGVQVMSPYIIGLPESSVNIGICGMNENEAVLRYSVRSSLLSYKHYLRDKIISLINMTGGKAQIESEYPAWEYKKDSKLRDIYENVYVKEYGCKPKFEAIHAGLECGIINEKIPKADIISIGPNMKDIHTPEERLSITSFIKLYKFLEKLLENMI